MSAPTGCVAPQLGARVHTQLGLSLEPGSPEAAHAGRCIACALERRSWDTATQHPAPVPERLIHAVLRGALRG